jgi:hypothetical protein
MSVDHGHQQAEGGDRQIADQDLPACTLIFPHIFRSPFLKTGYENQSILNSIHIELIELLELIES